MTVSNETKRVTYNGDGSTTAFPVTFVFLENSHVQAILRDSDGDETTWVEGSDYTLTGGDGSTGTLTATTAPASGETLTILRDMPLTQETDYPEGGVFPAQSHEDALDFARMVDQQLQEQLDRTPKYPVTDPDTAIGDLPNSIDRAGKFLGFAGDGTPTAIAGDTDTAVDVSDRTVTATDGTTSRTLATWLDPLDGLFEPRIKTSADTLFGANRNTGIFLNPVPETDTHHDIIHILVDANDQTDGFDKVAGLFSARANNTVDIFGLNPLVEFTDAYSGNAIAIEADVNNKSNTAGLGIGLLVNGASSNKILAGIIVRMSGGAAGGQEGIRIEDDWDNQLILQGSATQTLINSDDSGSDVHLRVDLSPASSSDEAQIRLFRATDAATARVILFKGDASATQQIELNATTGRTDANAFRSGRQTIADDDVHSFTPPEVAGTIVLIRIGAGDGIHAAFDDLPDINEIGQTGTTYELTTGALTGTTGTDVKVTLSIDSSGVIYIENRLGASVTFQWTILAN